MTIKEIEKDLSKEDFLVAICYSRKTVYEVRNAKDVRKYTITSKQFDNLKTKFGFEYFNSVGFGIPKHYYKQKA
jgi:hypothetical protein